MPTDPAIRAALDVAGVAMCVARARVNECDAEPCRDVCQWCKAGCAAAVAAFLQAMPGNVIVRPTWAGVHVEYHGGRDIAAAVEAAAKGDA